jgi:hypothetical protein
LFFGIDLCLPVLSQPVPVEIHREGRWNQAHKKRQHQQYYQLSHRPSPLPFKKCPETVVYSLSSFGFRPTMAAFDPHASAFAAETSMADGLMTGN